MHARFPDLIPPITVDASMTCQLIQICVGTRLQLYKEISSLLHVLSSFTVCRETPIRVPPLVCAAVINAGRSVAESFMQGHAYSS